MSERTTLTIVFDVTGFTKAQIGALTTEAIVQGEDSNDAIGENYVGHPDAPVVSASVTREIAL